MARPIAAIRWLFRLRNRVPVSDDGRAFQIAQSFDVHDLEVGAEVCLVVRIDAGVAGQRSAWTIGTRQAGMTDTGLLRADGLWRTKVLSIPSDAAPKGTIRVRESFVSSASDINVFRVEAYQARTRQARGR